MNFKTFEKKYFRTINVWGELSTWTLNLNPAHPHSRGGMSQIRDIFTVRRIFDKMPAENKDEKVDLSF